MPDSPESLEAFEQCDVSRMRGIVLEYLREQRTYGSTADEACIGLNLGTNSVAPRLHELERSGLLVRPQGDTGRHIRRMTRQGRPAAVYVAIEYAPAQHGHETPLFPEFDAMSIPRQAIAQEGHRDDG
jgi:hypothetical protein